MIIRMGRSATEQKRFEAPYIRACFDGSLESVKEPERRKVYNFIERHRPKYLKLFSLPGVGWKFERAVSEADRQAEFVGVERLGDVMYQGRLFMPGSYTKPLREERGDIEYSGVHAGRCRWFRAELSGFLSFYTDRGSKCQRRQWANKYKSMTAIWLDFMSPLCRETAFCLPHLGNICCRNVHAVPTVVTLMMGREPSAFKTELDRVNADPLTKRVAAVASLINSGRWRDFHVLDAWSYQSSVPMMTVAGILTATRSEQRITADHPQARLLGVAA